MYDNPISPTDQRDAMQTLRDAGVATVTVEFSGGNDEGGADDAHFLDAEGNAVTAIPRNNAYNESGSRYDPASGKFIQNDPRWVVYAGGDKRDATPDEVKIAKVISVLEHPIYDRWGSFAGEFYVHGTLTWDVVKGTHTLEGQESHEVWESI